MSIQPSRTLPEEDVAPMEGDIVSNIPSEVVNASTVEPTVDDAATVASESEKTLLLILVLTKLEFCER